MNHGPIKNTKIRGGLEGIKLPPINQPKADNMSEKDFDEGSASDISLDLELKGINDPIEKELFRKKREQAILDELRQAMFAKAK